MALRSRLGRFQNGCHRSSRREGTVIAAATKSGKGFGDAQKQEAHKPTRDGAPKGDKQMFKEAAAAISGHRPVKPEEAAQGKLDYVQVADWGDGDRAKLGNLRLVSHVKQYEGGGADDGDGASTAAAGGGPGIGGGGQGGGRRPFHMQLAHQLTLAEARGALAVAGPPPPPVSEWSFRPGRYQQFLADLLEVHSALEAALLTATAFASSSSSTAAPASTSPSGGPDNGALASSSPPSAAPSSSAATAAAASPSLPPPPPPQGALHALLHLAPGRLGLERSDAIRRDLRALRATTAAAATAADAAAATLAAGAHLATEAEAGRTGAGVAGEVAAGASGDGGGGEAAEAEAAAAGRGGVAAGPMARSYAQVLQRLGRVAAGGEGEQERQGAALRLLAHAAVLHLVAQAVWTRVGATAAERLSLLQRRAAATYHDYPQQVTDPRVTLSVALDAAGEHLRSGAARQIVYDEVASAMQKTGLLLSALAHWD